MIVCDSRLELEAQVVRPLQQLPVRCRRDAVLRRLIQIPDVAVHVDVRHRAHGPESRLLTKLANKIE